MRGFVFLVFLFGCTTAKTVYLPDGREGHRISCGGSVQSMADCREKAGKICGSQGYRIITQDEEETLVDFGGGPSVGYSRDMLIVCGGT